MVSLDRNAPCPGCFRRKGDMEKCPHCGYDTSAPRNPGLLRWWTLLRDRYLIGREYRCVWPLRRYLAWDKAENKPVVVGEYDAKEVAGEELAELPYKAALNMDWESAYEGFMQGFLEQMRKLARLDNYHLERVRDVFSVNVKAYAVLDYMPGMSLNDYLSRAGGAIPENSAVAVMLPILDALRELNAAGLYGCRVDESTIFLVNGTRPVLLSPLAVGGNFPEWYVQECAALLKKIVPQRTSPGLAALLEQPPEDLAAFRRALQALLPSS